jgi:hypothetical protein
MIKLKHLRAGLFILLLATIGNVHARFVSVDPVKPDTSNGQNFNRYHYGNNNPYKFTDPDGRQTIPLEHRIGTNDPGITQTFLHHQGKVGSAVADFVPGVGDIKGAVDAYNNPTFGSIAAAGVGLLGPVGDLAGGLLKNADNVGTLFHYTDEAGARGIAETGQIRPDANGRVFLTTDQVSASEANNALFMGQGGTKGSHVVEVNLRQGASLTPGTQPNELIHQGTIRDARQADIKVRENDF